MIPLFGPLFSLKTTKPASSINVSVLSLAVDLFFSFLFGATFPEELEITVFICLFAYLPFVPQP